VRLLVLGFWVWSQVAVEVPVPLFFPPGSVSCLVMFLGRVEIRPTTGTSPYKPPLLYRSPLFPFSRRGRMRLIIPVFFPSCLCRVWPLGKLGPNSFPSPPFFLRLSFEDDYSSSSLFLGSFPKHEILPQVVKSVFFRS